LRSAVTFRSTGPVDGEHPSGDKPGIRYSLFRTDP
jgi:hypothetical protein